MRSSRKVMSTFRSKLAVKAEAAVDGHWMGSDPTLNDWTRFRIEIKIITMQHVIV